VEQLSEKPVELGRLCTGSRVPGRLVDAAVSHQGCACPSKAGLRFSTRSWSQAGPDGWGGGLVLPRVAGAQQGLKGSGLGGRGRYPGELWDRLQAGVHHRLVAGIPVVVDPVAQLRGVYSSVAWVRGLEAGSAEGWVSRHVWFWHGAVTWHSLRGGEPSRPEQQLCRPTGW
jgi:hypothetical protein